MDPVNKLVSPPLLTERTPCWPHKTNRFYVYVE
jgi:hypothetical protein